jgi:hypothetical protein
MGRAYLLPISLAPLANLRMNFPIQSDRCSKVKYRHSLFQLAKTFYAYFFTGKETWRDTWQNSKLVLGTMVCAARLNLTLDFPRAAL